MDGHRPPGARPGRKQEPTVPCPACRAERLTSIAVAVGGVNLTMRSCGVCRRRFWERDGEPVTLEQVLGLLGPR